MANVIVEKDLSKKLRGKFIVLHTVEIGRIERSTRRNFAQRKLFLGAHTDHKTCGCNGEVMGNATPTPWRIEQVNYSQGLDVSFEILGVDNSLVCQTIMREKKTPEIIRHDFRNMSTVVTAVNAHADLVAALEDLCDIAYLTINLGTPKEIQSVLQRIEEARAVLAKAKEQL
jgi:hypothetical protein